MGRKKNSKVVATNTKVAGRTLIETTDEGQILELCVSITKLKLDPACGLDRQYAKTWYEKNYLTGKHVRYSMKKDLSISHNGDGIVYRAFNTTDAIAERLMKENKDYKDYFEDFGPVTIEAPEDSKPEEEDPNPEETPEQEDSKPEETPADESQEVE